MASHLETPTSAQPHLSDEQFADLLLGSNPSVVQSHLSACAQCAQEAERISGAIGSFEQQTRLWAERRISTQPVLTLGRQSAFWLPAGAQAWTAAALAAILAAGVGIAGRNHRLAVRSNDVAQSLSGQTAAAAAAPASLVAVAPVSLAKPEAGRGVSPARLKADNDLLSAIDGELRADQSDSASAYGLTVSSEGVRATTPDGMINE